MGCRISFSFVVDADYASPPTIRPSISHECSASPRISPCLPTYQSHFGLSFRLGFFTSRREHVWQTQRCRESYRYPQPLCENQWFESSGSCRGATCKTAQQQCQPQWAGQGFQGRELDQQHQRQYGREERSRRLTVELGTRLAGNLGCVCDTGIGNLAVFVLDLGVHDLTRCSSLLRAGLGRCSSK